MDDKITIKSNVDEINLHFKVENKETKPESNGTGCEKPSQCNDKIADKNSIKIATDLLHNEIVIKKELSEGEASSGFETVSSVDSHINSDILDLSSIADEEDFNVVVEIENELALQNHLGASRRNFHWKETKNIPSRYSSRTENSSGNYTNRRHNFRGNTKYWRSNNEDTHYKYDRRDKNSSERESFSYNRRQSFRDHDWDRNTNWNRRPGIRRRSDSRPRYSRSTESTPRSRDSRSPERNIRVRSPGSKERKGETRSLRSFDKNVTKPSTKRSSPPRKRRRSSFSKSPTSSVWKRLEKRTSPNSEKRSRKSSRKKERTPFLVELERKLKEATELKNSKKDVTNEPRVQPEFATEMLNTPATSEAVPRIAQNPIPPCSSNYIPPPPNIPSVGYPFNYSFPAMSVDNLPLVLGPTGVPVHITMTGEQIPHDFEGKIIPVGPNGHYLPLDPTGRLFAHIISPGNQAVPIHMTEDGVLRLPNSEPVPYGPIHQLPVNIDGRVIPIGPDSKPLTMPCPDLPRRPPLGILKLVNSTAPENTSPQGIPQIVPPVAQTKNPLVAAPPEPQPAWSRDEGNFQTPKTDCTIVDVTQKPSQKKSTTDSLKSNKRKPEKKSESVETRKSFGTKRSTPMRLSLKKTPKGDTSGSDMILDSDDSDSTTGVKSGLKSKKALTEEIALSSDDEQDILNMICDKETSKASEAKPNELIIKKVESAIKSLCDRNYKPPEFGRFFVSNPVNPSSTKSPNESPLLRNRMILPFLTLNSANSYAKTESAANEKTEITFKFLPQRVLDEGEKFSDVPCDTVDKNSNTVKVPVFTFDFAVQCDFTSVTINHLNSKVTELEMEVVRLRNANESLLEDYRNAQIMNEKKSDELRKAMLEIRGRKKRDSGFGTFR